MAASESTPNQATGPEPWLRLEKAVVPPESTDTR